MSTDEVQSETLFEERSKKVSASEVQRFGLTCNPVYVGPDLVILRLGSPLD